MQARPRQRPLPIVAEEWTTFRLLFDLRFDMAAEARAKITYKRLIGFTDDSTGSGELGGEYTGPWNSGGDWEKIDNPPFDKLRK
jgi:hypothetical protein